MQNPTDDAARAPSPRLMSMRDVTRLTTYARPSIYRLVKQGRFPKPIKLGDVKIAFRADEIEAWLDSRPRALDGEAAPAATAQR